MYRELVRQRRIRLFQSLVLAALMVYLAVRAAALIFGSVGAWVAVIAVAAISIYSLGGKKLLLPSGTYALAWSDAPELFYDLRLLVRTAGISSVPKVLVIPDARPQAMTTGVGESATIILSRGLLRALSRRELRAVVAHEIAHIRNHDLPLFAVIGAMQYLTRAVAGALTILVFISFPLLLVGYVAVPPEAFLYLSIVPLVSIFLVAALLRTREYQADIGAVQLTGDADALASALARIDGPYLGVWHRLFRRTAVESPRRSDGLGELLRTHPHTSERIRRLRALGSDYRRAS